jgi:hypothetical protein
MKNITIFCVAILFVFNNIFAVNYYSTNNGSWSSNIWSLNGYNDTFNLTYLPCSLNSNDSVFINHEVLVVCNSIMMGAAGSSHLIIENEAYLTVNSDLRLYNISTISNYGNLSINGNLILYGNSIICGEGNLDYSGTLLLNDNSYLCTTLPFDLLYFKGKKNDNNILLEWIMNSQHDNKKIEVERSFNGVDFNVIAQIETTINSREERLYSYIDTEDLSSYLWAYYRLKQIDFDNKFAYSDIVAVETLSFKSKSDALIYPNPASSEFELEFNTECSSGQIVIYNNKGEYIEKRNFRGQLEREKLNFDCRIWPNGNYIVLINTATQRKFQRILIHN